MELSIKLVEGECALTVHVVFVVCVCVCMCCVCRILRMRGFVGEVEELHHIRLKNICATFVVDTNLNYALITHCYRNTLDQAFSRLHSHSEQSHHVIERCTVLANMGKTCSVQLLFKLLTIDF